MAWRAADLPLNFGPRDKVMVELENAASNVRLMVSWSLLVRVRGHVEEESPVLGHDRLAAGQK